MSQVSCLALKSVGKSRISLDGHTIVYAIKRSTRAKHVRLEVGREHGLTVVVPRSYRIDRLSKLLEAKRVWILGKLGERDNVRPLSAETLKDGDKIPYLGRERTLKIQRNYSKVDAVKLEQNTLLVSLISETDRLELFLERWYRLQADSLMKKKVETFSVQLGVSYNRIVIRGQKTRWGSCSHKGNLNLNWKLVMAPEPVIDYVVIHELAHLKEMNHTKNFWKLVAEHCPQWRERRKWLKDHGVELASRLSSSG
ncbi:M48 family metallopeptidase [Chloroflexota bacterium]